MRRVFVDLACGAIIAGGSLLAYEWLVLGVHGIIYKAGLILALLGAFQLWRDTHLWNRHKDMELHKNPRDASQ